MKTIKKLGFLVLAGFSITGFSQTSSMTCQFYLDVNNNCTYDSGDQPVYLPGDVVKFSYMNNAASISTANLSYTATCSNPGTVITNYASPPVNTLVISSLPDVLPDLGCNAFNNIPYNGTVNIPLSKANGMSSIQLTCPAPLFIYHGAFNTSSVNLHDTFPICSNIGNDTLVFVFPFCQILSCSQSGGTSTRTYSVYLDGVQYDQITTTGTQPNLSVGTFGGNNMCRLSEAMTNTVNSVWLYTKLPSGISALGSHTFAIKSTSIYPHPLSVMDYSCVLNVFPCSMISGKFYNDCNNNCVLDSNEIGMGSGVQGKIYNSNGTDITFTPDYYGNFSLFLSSANTYSLTHYPTSSGYSACATTTVTISPLTNTNTLVFGYKKQNPYQNLSNFVHAGIGLGGISYPGTITNVIYLNTFNNMSACNSTPGIVSGTQKIVIEKFLSYVGTISGPPPTTIIPASGGDTLVWTTSDFATLSSGSFSLAISPTVSLLTPFVTKGYIYPSTDDFFPDNSCFDTGIIGAPYDPNSKVLTAVGLLPNGDLDYNSVNGQSLDYLVNFQNLGSAPAVNVKTLDTIDVNLDLNSIKILGSSRPVSMQVDNASRLVTFMFDNIYLSYPALDEPGSHGFVRYSINLNNGIPLNTVIKNRAHNYFDFTSPVATNQTKNKLVISTGIKENNTTKNEVYVFPNPVHDKLYLEATTPSDLSIYNLQGNLLREVMLNIGRNEIIISELPAGIYLVQAKNGAGIWRGRFVKE